MIKGKGQRLIPEELLKYLEAYKENHPDPAGGGGATLEDIVDSAGNKRFIEGDGTPVTISGVTYTYNKWSLSGTHLMVVLAGDIVANTGIVGGQKMTKYSIPEFILNKTFPLTDSGYLDQKNAYIKASGGSSLSKTFEFSKTNDGLEIIFSSGGTISLDSKFRVQFDLLIDADYS